VAGQHAGEVAAHRRVELGVKSIQQAGEERASPTAEYIARYRGVFDCDRCIVGLDRAAPGSRS